MPALKERAVSTEIAKIRPGDLRIHATSEPKLHNVRAIDALAKVHGVQADMMLQMKTFGPDQGDIHWNDGSGQIAKLSDVVVTLSQPTNPNTGVTTMEMSLEYYVTSDGARAPDPSRNEGNNQQMLFFRNASGGLVYVWYLGSGVAYKPNFDLQCGWNRQYQLQLWTEKYNVGWFDAVAGYQWSVGGGFFRC